MSGSTGEFAAGIAVMPAAGDPVAGITVKSPATLRLIVGLGSASLATICVFQGVQQVLMPLQVQQIDALHKIGNLALLTSLAAGLAVVGSLAGGVLSDRTHSRFGRRSPWLVAMAVVSAGLMAVMATLHSISVIAVFYAALWFCMNFYQAVLGAIIPDRIPESSRGATSSAFGLGGALGLGLGVSVVAHTSMVWGYLILAGLVLGITALCVVLVREWATPELAQSALDGKSENAVAAKFSWIGIFEAFRSRDFILAFVTRAMMFTALSVVSGYSYYILQDRIGVANLPGHSVKTALSVLTASQTVVWLVSVSGAGWLADRLDRRKLFVGICSIGGAAAMLVPLLSPTWPGFFAFYVLVGMFFGTYLAVDLALMTLVLPSRENEGRDLAILSIANSGPQLISPAIAAAIISMAGYDALFWFGFAVSLLAGVAVFFIRSVR